MFVGYTNWGDCFEMEGSWYTVNYLSTYPDRDYMNSIPDTYAVFTFPEDRCTDSNKYYFEYSQFPLSWLDFPGGCVEAGGGYYYTLDYSECEESHTLTGIFYMNSDCSGDPSFTYPLLPVCEGDDDDDYDDGNDDDDNWEYTHSLESYYCT
ncbi:unnamed protein product [Symbiodinium microadriaticum]|nr:unnamed protein product [Symbiodinium microadriaticum]